MNSYSPNQTPDFKKPYGMFLADQKQCLDDIYNTIKSMRCIGKTAHQIF